VPTWSVDKHHNKFPRHERVWKRRNTIFALKTLRFFVDSNPDRVRSAPTDVAVVVAAQRVAVLRSPLGRNAERHGSDNRRPGRRQRDAVQLVKWTPPLLRQVAPRLASDKAHVNELHAHARKTSFTQQVTVGNYSSPRPTATRCLGVALSECARLPGGWDWKARSSLSPQRAAQATSTTLVYRNISDLWVRRLRGDSP